jgi:hypothetical protein
MIALGYRDLMAQAVGHYGDGATLTLRQDNTVRAALAVYGAVSGGATSLVAAGGNEKGDVVTGSKFSVAGVSGVYTVADASTAVAGRLTLNFTPALAGPAADGAALTWTQTYGETSYPIMSGHREDFSKDEIERGVETFALPWLAAKPAPRDKGNDLLGGKKITKVQPLDAGGGVSGYRVTVAVAS